MFNTRRGHIHTYASPDQFPGIRIYVAHTVYKTSSLRVKLCQFRAEKVAAIRVYICCNVRLVRFTRNYMHASVTDA